MDMYPDWLYAIPPASGGPGPAADKKKPIRVKARKLDTSWQDKRRPTVEAKIVDRDK